jgi:cob(I)alamin adenosyltransferase
MSIMTKRGDDGETDLMFGKRIAKTSLRIGALGAVDELNTALGLARVAGLKNGLQELIDTTQERLVGLMGELATLSVDSEKYREAGYKFIIEEDVTWLENHAEEIEKHGIKFTGWAKPGAEGALGSAALDFARTAARRAERNILQLSEEGEKVTLEVKLYLNRLSDLLWLMARMDAK